jgi:hypothetical protein
VAEIYCHTDEDGYRVSVTTGADGDLMVSAYPVEDFNRISAVDVPAVDGRRLLAALERYYAVVDAPEVEDDDPLWAAEQAKRAKLAPLADFVVRVAQQRHDPAVTVHRCPTDRSGVMPCCGRTPFEAPGDRMTLCNDLVTCEPSRGGTVATEPDTRPARVPIDEPVDFSVGIGEGGPVARAERKPKRRMADGCGPEHTYRDGCEHAEDGA